MGSWRLRVFLGARVLSTLGDQVLQFAVPLIIYTATGSVSLAGLAFLVEWLPRLSSLPLAGVLSDRFGGRRVYAASDSVRAVACLLTALALASWPGHVFGLTAALMALCAFCYAQTFIALESTIPQLVPQKDLAKAQSVLQIINSGSGVFGPALGGLMLLWVSPTRLLWVSGVAFAVGACGVAALRGLGAPAAPATAAPAAAAPATAAPATRAAGVPVAGERAAGVPVDARRSVLGDLRVGVRSLAGAPILLSLVGLTMVANLMVGLAVATGAPLTIGHFHQRDAVFATLQITVGVFSIVTLLSMTWLLRRLSVYRIGVLSFLVSVAGVVLIGVAPLFPLYVLGYGLCLGMTGLFNVFIRVERLHWIAPAERGRVISLIVLLNQSTLPLAGGLVALVGAVLPVQVLFLAVAVLAWPAYALLLRPLAAQAMTARPAAPAVPVRAPVAT
ncbi:Major Facilitator Superfamily protein [Parafrankia irregularis]|uniref:Major Facilitator Superfamily protein n=1 Tax=Parafrankia irregularis TaxID=795642 RepID=A0A0S4QY37_9ACTN|nr:MULTISPECIES: MFS transporter [Parafrankia]MBE3205798.1 MFS transporter [Parafrankia sp. CH37]CUU59672.1 Major Facilitator Superfamily protein [Parafrankia irregularis]